MPYLTTQQLHESPGAKELAEVASDDHKPMVSYELMEAALLGDDASAWSEDDTLAAQEALTRINDAIADASGLIDGYLRKAGHTLPLVTVPRLVTVWCRAITRYYLHKNRRSLESEDSIVRDYKDAQKLLKEVSEGKMALGLSDEVVQSGAGMPLVSAGDRPMRNAIRDF